MTTAPFPYPLRAGRRPRHGMAAALALSLACASFPCLAQPRDRVLPRPSWGPPSVVVLETDGVDGISGQLADDLARLYDDGSTRRALPIIGKTAGQNLRDLLSLRGIDMAVLPTDVILQAQNRANKAQPDLVTSFTYAAPLWQEEFHLLARSDIQTVTDLANRPVDVGPPDSLSSITAARLFGLMKLPFQPVTDRPDLALEELAHGNVDAVAIVAAKPSGLLQALSLPQGWHFLSIPPEKAVTDAYSTAALEASDYPGLIPKNEPVQTISVQTVLAVANLAPASERYKSVAAFVTALLDGAHMLLDPGHQLKWREVDMTATVPGLTRFAAAQAWIDRAKAASQSAPQDMKTSFSRFIDSRQQVLGGLALSDGDKQALFEQFEHWRAVANRPTQ